MYNSKIKKNICYKKKHFKISERKISHSVSILCNFIEVEQLNIDVSTDAESRKEGSEHRKHKFGSGILRYCCNKGKKDFPFNSLPMKY